jgi:hypothetical protein
MTHEGTGGERLTGELHSFGTGPSQPVALMFQPTR